MNKKLLSASTVLCGILALGGMLTVSGQAKADQQIQDDLIVDGSICVGLDCVNGEDFGFDTLRLKENNLRIRFQDTSSSSSFPTRDWEITINDSVNGGANYFAIKDVDAGKVPFTILADAPNNSLYVSSTGHVGFGTTTPLVDLNVKSGNTPTLRLEQDGSSGFAAQAWDVAGNETNFFIRDVTNGSKLPFRLSPNAPNSSIHIAANGDIGFQTSTPDGQFDVAHSADANNHAFLIGTNSAVGINIDNGQIPQAWLDVQTTGGVSRFAVAFDGNVGIGTVSPTGRFDVRDVDNTRSYFNVDATGNVGVGTNTPEGRFEIKSTDGLTSLLKVAEAGGLVVPGNDCTTVDDVTTCTASDIASITLAKWKIGTVKQTIGSGRNVVETGFDNLAFSYDGTEVLTLTHTGLLIQNDLCEASVNINCVANIVSSKYLKNIFSPVDGADILDKVSSLPISVWSYKEDDAILHIGPMAEDFHATFGLNGDVTDKIAIVDALGVALASIQALHSELKQKELDIQALKQDVEDIKRLLQQR